MKFASIIPPKPEHLASLLPPKKSPTTPQKSPTTPQKSPYSQSSLSSLIPERPNFDGDNNPFHLGSVEEQKEARKFLSNREVKQKLSTNFVNPNFSILTPYFIN